MTDRDIMQQAMEALQAVKEAPSKDEIQRAWIVSDLLQKRLAQPDPVIDKSAAIRIATVLGWVPPSDTSQERVDEAEKQRQEQEPVAWKEGYAAGAAAEREACACTVASIAGDDQYRWAADAIRARGQA